MVAIARRFRSAGLSVRSGFGVSMRITDFFFDRPHIERRVNQANRRNLNHAGGLVRKIAKNSMRRRKRSSEPGTPPSAHAESGSPASLKNILYGYDDQAGDGRGGVIVGPVFLNQLQYSGRNLMRGTVPSLHEFGGTVGLREKKVGQSWRPVGRRRPRPGQPVRIRRATYPARPFMKPALKKAAPKFRNIWADSITG